MTAEHPLSLLLPPEEIAALTRAASRHSSRPQPADSHSAPARPAAPHAASVRTAAPQSAPVRAAVPYSAPTPPAVPNPRPARLAAPALVLIPPPERPPVRARPFERQLRAIRVPAFVTIAVFAISLASIKYAAMSREQDTPLAPPPRASISIPPAAQPAAPSPIPSD